MLSSFVFRDKPPGGGLWALFEGSALQVLKGLESDSCDCVVTSPPYFRQVDYAVSGQYGQELRSDHYIRKVQSIAQELLRVCRPGSTMFWVVRDSSNGSGGPGGDYSSNGESRLGRCRGAYDKGIPRKAQLMIPERTRVAIAAAGWVPRMDVIWRKTGAPRPADDRPSYVHEHILFFSKGSDPFWDSGAAALANSRGLTSLDSVWYISSGSQPAVDVNGELVRGQASFPLLLPEICIVSGCPPEGVVIDPFCGMGTTLLAAQKWGRSSIGIDLSSRMIKVCKHRLLAQKGKCV